SLLEIRRLQIGAREIGIDEVGLVEVGSDGRRLNETAFAELAFVEVSFGQVSALEGRHSQIGAAKRCTLEIGPREIRGDTVDIRQLCARKLRLPQVALLEDRVRQVCV